jgi:hypothetical protein
MVVIQSLRLANLELPTREAGSTAISLDESRVITESPIVSPVA